MTSSKTSLKATLIAGLFAAISPALSQAMLFDWSYTFIGGEKVVGRIEADRGDAYLENFKYVTWTFLPADGTLTSTAFIGADFLGIFGPQRIPVDGGTDGLCLSFEVDTNGKFDFNFSIGQGEGDYTHMGALSLTAWRPGGGPVYEKNELGKSGWNLAPAVAVAEGGATLVLLSFTLTGLVWMHRRNGRRVGIS